MTIKLDEINSKLLEVLHNVNHASSYELGERLFISSDAIRKRLNRLKEAGILVCEKKPSSKPSPATNFFSLKSDWQEIKPFIFANHNYFKRELKALSQNALLALYVVAKKPNSTSAEISPVFTDIITPQAVRHHLYRLLAKGLIERVKLNKIDNWFYHYRLTDDLNSNIILAEIESRQIEFINHFMNILNHKHEETKPEDPRVESLSPFQREILEHINENSEKGLSMSDLVNLTGKDNLHYHMNKILEKSLVRREQDPDWYCPRHIYYPIAESTNYSADKSFSNTDKNQPMPEANFNNEDSLTLSNGSAFSNSSSDAKQNSKLSPEATNCFSKLNQYKEMKKKLKQLEQEIISLGGEEAEKFIYSVWSDQS